MSQTELYLVRHGEATPNTHFDNIGGYSIGAELTDRGIEQARACGTELLNRGVNPSEVYCSTALRTQSTAAYLLESMDLNIDIGVYTALLEMDQEPYQGRFREEIANKQSQEGQKGSALHSFKSMAVAGIRLHNWLIGKFADKDRIEPSQVLVVSHDLAISGLASTLLNWGKKKALECPAGDALISKFVLKKNKIQVEYLNT